MKKLDEVYRRLQKEGTCLWCKRAPALPGWLLCERCLATRRKPEEPPKTETKPRLASPMEVAPETVGELLTGMREEEGITKAEAGRRSTISSCVIGQYERGETIPGVYNLAHLLKAYGWRLIAEREES